MRSMSGIKGLWVVVGAALAALAVTGAPSVLADEAISEQAKQEAEQIFAQRCVTCHGADGAGTGPAAAALNPKPRDYSDEEWQKATSDEKIAKAIVKGGPAVGMSPLMPPNPDLEKKPEVVKALVAKIRSFADG